MERPLKLVVFTSLASPYAPIVLEALFFRYHELIQAVVTVNPVGTTSRVKKILAVMRTAGARYAALKLILFGSIRLRQFLGSTPTISSLCRKSDIRLITVESLKAPAALDLLRNIGPDVLLSVLFEKIFPEEILRIPTMAALNFHPAPLPRYAGIAPTFWVLSEGEKRTAVTLHYLDAGIDTGDIFSHHEVEIEEHDSVHRLYVRCCKKGSEQLCDALENILTSKLPRTAQNVGERTYFSAPTRTGYKSLRAKHHSLWRLRDLIAPWEMMYK